MDKFKYTLYAKCYCDNNNKSYAVLNSEEKIKEFAELFLKADIDTITAKLLKTKVPLIKNNLTRLRQDLMQDLDELKKESDFNV